MPGPSSPQPTLAHRVEFLLFRGLERVLAATSMGACVTLGRLFGDLFHLFSRKYRRLVRRNLRIATAATPLSARQLDALVEETFQRAGANFVASLKTPTLEKEQLAQFIEADGIETLQQAYEADQGVVVAMPHMGNWEALTQLGNTYCPGPYGGVYRPLDNPLLDELTRQRRTADDAQLFSRKDGFHPPAALLRDRGTLVVLADQRAGGRGTALPFFGKLTTCSPLPDLMARRGKARLASLAIVTLSAERWKLVLTPLPDTSDTAEIMRGIEQAIRLSPADVFWFHDRWRTDSARPLSQFAKIDPEVARQATVPLRLVLTTPASAPEEGVRAMLDAMLDTRPDLRIDRLMPHPLPASDPRVTIHPFDLSSPPEQVEGLIARLDATRDTPLDGALLFDANPSLARAARRAGLRSIIGFKVSGKPWTRSFDPPSSIEDWRKLAELMARVPKKQRR